MRTHRAVSSNLLGFMHAAQRMNLLIQDCGHAHHATHHAGDITHTPHHAKSIHKHHCKRCACIARDDRCMHERGDAPSPPPRIDDDLLTAGKLSLLYAASGRAGRCESLLRTGDGSA